MIIEIFIICVTLYALFSPITYAKAKEIRERANKMEMETDREEYVYNTSALNAAATDGHE
jgi:hypothetical protein